MGSAAGAAAARARRLAASQATALPLEQQAREIRLVAVGVDTLELHTAAPLRGVFLEHLWSLKKQAQAALKGQPGPTWRCAGHVFTVSRSGGRRGPLVLEADDVMAVSLNPDAPEGLPTAMVELRSRHLWADLDVAAQDGEEVLSVLTEAEDPDVQVSRVDVTVDWQGWAPDRGLIDSFTCRARKDASYRANRKHTGWSWGGGGAVYARMYDKTVEIEGTPKAEWFPAVWAKALPARVPMAAYVPAVPVWRLELQVKREAIREFGGADLELPAGALKSWEGTREHLGSIFHTLTSDWISLRLPRTANERAVLDPRWAALRRANFATLRPPVDLARIQTETEFRRCLDQLGAYMARGIAERWALDGARSDARLTAVRLIGEVEKRFARKHHSLEGRALQLYEPLKAKAQASIDRTGERSRRAADRAASAARQLWDGEALH